MAHGLGERGGRGRDFLGEFLLFGGAAGVSNSRVKRARSRSRIAITTSALVSSAEIIFQLSI